MLDVAWRNNSMFASCSQARRLSCCAVAGAHRRAQHAAVGLRRASAASLRSLSLAVIDLFLSRAAALQDKTIVVCRVGDARPTKVWQGHSDEINSIQWGGGGRLLASCSDDRTVKIWHYAADRAHGGDKPLHTLKGGCCEARGTAAGHGGEGVAGAQSCMSGLPHPPKPSCNQAHPGQGGLCSIHSKGIGLSCD